MVIVYTRIITVRKKQQYPFVWIPQTFYSAKARVLVSLGPFENYINLVLDGADGYRHFEFRIETRCLIRSHLMLDIFENYIDLNREVRVPRIVHFIHLYMLHML